MDMGTCLGDVSLLSPLHRPSGLSLEKLIITFANSLDLDQARHKKVGLDLHLTASGLMLIHDVPGRFFPK